MTIDPERLAATFTRLCETDSPSRCEGQMAQLMREICTGLGAAAIDEDDSAAVTGSECGNLLIRFDGDPTLEPVLLSCHLDTVEPGTGVRVVRQGDTFTSAGDTILGADDKAGIAAIVEALHALHEEGQPHAPLELLLTTCEEIGLLGAKAFDVSRLRSRLGYALDTSGMGRVVLAAPASNRLHISVRGVAAHAGLNPEAGLNAIRLAALALAQAPCGRIDRESTVNFGTIRGGTASNIVPDLVEIHGEVRSHSEAKLDTLTEEICRCFSEATRLMANLPDGRERALAEVRVLRDFPAMRIGKEEPVARRIAAAAAHIAMPLEFTVAGGGSDANILSGQGIPTVIVASGMRQVHSTAEHAHLPELVRLSELLCALLRPLPTVD
ncbi:MAG: peptidase M20 [Desulfobulbaceae bacterium A2]|nr:MAG: peptidase M20 [Desulfobulbaceae bacterium A2]